MPTRLVVCVDGTWFGPDGKDGTPQGNISNVLRIWTVVKEGLVIENDGRRFEQKKRYFEGIGVGETGPRRWGDGIWGTGCPALIKRVYQCCCETLTGPEDELWLYGYSRGAFVVRAVAGLVHHIQLLKFSSQGHFDGNYDTAVKIMKHIRAGDRDHQGESHRYFHEAVRDPPKVRFVGIFDSVKAFDDNQLFEVFYTKSIDHLRHAVSLNENRPKFDPELIHLSEDPNIFNGPRSMIQAWFLGTHSDLGGGSTDDGRSLYPLQWILTESRRFGLELEYRRIKHDGGDLIENPLEIAFPTDSTPSSNEEERSELGPYSENTGESWLFEYEGGIQVQLYDLRPKHARNITRKETLANAKDTSRNFKDKKIGTKLSIRRKKSIPNDLASENSSFEPSISTRVSSSYRIRFHSANLVVKYPRKPFQKHKLEGYNEKGRASKTLYARTCAN